MCVLASPLRIQPPPRARPLRTRERIHSTSHSHPGGCEIDDDEEDGHSEGHQSPEIFHGSNPGWVEPGWGRSAGRQRPGWQVEQETASGFGDFLEFAGDVLRRLNFLVSLLVCSLVSWLVDRWLAHVSSGS